MTERQAMKLSGLQDELRKRAMDMGFTAEQVDRAMFIVGDLTGEKSKDPFKAILDLLLKKAAGASEDGRKRKVAQKKAAPTSKNSTSGKASKEAPAPEEDDDTAMIEAEDEGGHVPRPQAKKSKAKSGRSREGASGSDGRGAEAVQSSGAGRDAGKKRAGRKAKSGFELFFLEKKDDILSACKSDSFGVIQKKVKQAWEDLALSAQEEWNRKASGKMSKDGIAESAGGKQGGEGKVVQASGQRKSKEAATAKAKGEEQADARNAAAQPAKRAKKAEGMEAGKNASSKGAEGGGAGHKRGGVTEEEENGRRAVGSVKERRKIDSHESDPSWLGYVHDPASEAPPIGEDCFAESMTMQLKTAEAMGKIDADKTIQNYQVFANTSRWLNMGLPALLHKALLYDWELVIGKRRVYQLPTDITVRAVTTMYSSSADVANSREKEVSSRRASFAEGLCAYFDTFVRTRLLYNAAELKQHDRLKKESEKCSDAAFSACDVYGAEHLIRLLSSLPELLALALPPEAAATGKQGKEQQEGQSQETTDNKSTQETTAMFHDFVRFIGNNFDTIVGNAEAIQRQL